MPFPLCHALVTLSVGIRVWRELTVHRPDGSLRGAAVFCGTAGRVHSIFTIGKDRSPRYGTLPGLGD